MDLLLQAVYLIVSVLGYMFVAFICKVLHVFLFNTPVRIKQDNQLTN